MFPTFVEFYDLIYLPMKDYAAEAAAVAALLRRHHPACHRVLDVACGTGEHARLLATHGFAVDGVDLDAAFVRLASAKHPAGDFVAADMCDFHLGRRYDAVVCLFSSIGYVRTIDRVEAALRCFREHLAADGVVLVEPWFPPGILNPDLVARTDAAGDGVQVSRESRVTVDGTISRLHFTYEISDAHGTRHASEVHELGLFTTNEMLEAFWRAGFEAQYDPAGPGGRGLYTATASGTS